MRGAESLMPALPPWYFALHHSPMPSKPSVMGQAGAKSPHVGEESGGQRCLLCTPFIPFGQSCAGSPPPALPGSLTAHQPLSVLGGEALGFPFQLVALPQARCRLLLCLCPLSSVLTGRRDHPPASVRVESGCQPPSDLPSLYGRGEEVFVGRMLGPLLGGGKKGSRTPARGFGFPSSRKLCSGGCDSWDKHFLRPMTTAAGGSAGFLVGPPRRAVSGPHTDPIYVAGPDAVSSGTTSREASDFIQASGQGSPRAAQMRGGLNLALHLSGGTLEA